MDIVNRIDEAIDKGRLMRHIKWDEMMYNFFNTYDFFMMGAFSSKAGNVNITNGQKVAQKAMMDLTNFFDAYPILDKYKNQYEKEQKKLAKLR